MDRARVQSAAETPRPLFKTRSKIDAFKSKEINKCWSVTAAQSHPGVAPPLSGLAGRLARAQAVNRAPAVYGASDLTFIRVEN